MRASRFWVGMAICVALCACGDDEEVSSEEEARRSYLGLDEMVEKAMDLGFQGFHEATSANIPVQSGVGDLQGTLTVGGQVDQGSSDNKEMRLTVALESYQDLDPPRVVYGTIEPAALEMSLKKIPDGTMVGTMVGTFQMVGDLEGDVHLNLALSSELEPDPDQAGGVRRKPGTSLITGTATSGYGVYNVEVTR